MHIVMYVYKVKRLFTLSNVVQHQNINQRCSFPISILFSQRSLVRLLFLFSFISFSGLEMYGLFV